MIVADCTLIVPMYVWGERTALSEAVFLRDAVWLAPSLWRSEMRNALRGYLRAGMITLSDARTGMRQAETQMIPGEVAVASDDVLDLVSSSGCSAYDAEYVVIAKGLGVPLVTADGELLRKFPGLAVMAESFAGVAE